MLTTGLERSVTLESIMLLPSRRGRPLGRTPLARAFPIVIGEDLLHVPRRSWAGCATRTTGSRSVQAGALTLDSITADDLRCGRKWNTSASARTATRRTRFVSPSASCFASEKSLKGSGLTVGPHPQRMRLNGRKECDPERATKTTKHANVYASLC